MSGGGGVNISLREIYDQVQTVGHDVKSTLQRLEALERVPMEVQALTKRVDEAHALATKAHEIAEESRQDRKWLWRTVITCIVTTIFTIATTILIFMFKESYQPPSTNVKESVTQ